MFPKDKISIIVTFIATTGVLTATDLVGVRKMPMGDFIMIKLTGVAFAILLAPIFLEVKCAN